jgi:AcrR family transcriptional regulator
MSATETPFEYSLARPMRADARRNYDKVLVAARDAFAERGASTSLEEIARRAGVGIGTLYRHFPTRQALLEAVYAHEVEEVCQTAADLDGADPWEALVGFLRRLSGYMATKQALIHELLDYVDREAPLFAHCRASIMTAGEPMLKRAQDAGVVRKDAEFSEILQLVGGIAKMPGVEPAQMDHLLGIVLDGLRYQPAADA